jgi:hypothetical protein
MGRYTYFLEGEPLLCVGANQCLMDFWVRMVERMGYSDKPRMVRRVILLQLHWGWFC